MSTETSSPAKAYGTTGADASLQPMTVQRRKVMAHDVEIEILYCGICHSDLHQARNEWKGTTYPCVPGHEIVGRVTRVGDHVKQFKVGDVAAVGCMVDSCRTCDPCQQDLEQFCTQGPTYTYNSPDKLSGGQTYGGYAERIVVEERFVLHIPAEMMDLAAAAPLLCAGITTYSPLRYWKAGPGKKVGIIGVGGLGHVAIKIARAMGAHVVVFTHSAAKAEDAKRLGAHEVVVSTDAAQMQAYASSLHLLLDTVSAVHDLNSYLNLLQLNGALVLVGLPEDALSVMPFNIVNNRRIFTGSSIGGIAETQEMLDFCAAHKITADIELISASQINEAYERLLKGDVRYRFVIDMASL